MKFNVELIQSSRIQGWIIDKEFTGTIIVQLFDGQSAIAETRADIFRPDLVAVNLTVHAAGFEFVLPRHLSNNQLRRLRIIALHNQKNLDIKESVIRFSEYQNNHPKISGPIGSFKGPWVPKVRSNFGGCWTDQDNAHDIVEGHLEMKWINDEEAKLLHHWVDFGYVVIEKAIEDEVIDSVLQEWDDASTGKKTGMWIETFEDEKKVFTELQADHKYESVKFLDLYSVSEAARQISLHDKIVRFINLVFHRPPLAFQSLSFWQGTQQPIHQDTAYVKVSSPMEMVATWVALEDIQAGTGELEYYPGSHKFKDFLWDGDSKWKLKNTPGEHQFFLNSLHQKAEEKSLIRKPFLAKKGDVLIWSADLAHGGSKVTIEGTRKSLVTHYCPNNCNPYYMYTTTHSERLKHGDAYYMYEVRKKKV